MTSTRFLIVGGGVAGLSTAWHLARAGAGGETLLAEAEPHLAAHSSALNAAILRTLSADPLSTRIALRSARFLREPPPGFADVPLVDARGFVLAAGRGRADEVESWLAAVADEAPRVERIGRAGLRARVPAFAGDVEGAWSFPEEGRIDIAALVAGFARGARRGGASLRRSARVAELLVEPGGGRVVGVRLADGEEILAGTTVIAAGGWAMRLGERAGSRVRLRPTRRHLMVTAPLEGAPRSWPVLWYLAGREAERGVAKEGGDFYCRPEGGGLLLCACEIADVDPDALAPDPDVRETIAAKVARYLPGLGDARAAHFWCGMRTLTADDRFAIGSDPDLDGLFWVAGLAGAGMVCGAEVGRIACALLSGASVEPQLAAALAPGRLATSRPLSGGPDPHGTAGTSHGAAAGSA